jgi:hypothetical protein
MKKLDSGCLNLRVIIGALMVASLLLGITFAALYVYRPQPPVPGQATAVILVLPAPTATPVPPTLAPVTPTSAGPANPDAAALAIGTYVKISGTGGDGLRLRSTAGLEGKVLVLAGEGEAFLVSDGPKTADGYTWWSLTGATDSTRTGWAVANYLTLTGKP